MGERELCPSCAILPPWCTLQARREGPPGAGRGDIALSTPKCPEDVRHLAAEVGRLFGLYHEQIDRLLAERTQENERLRAALGRLDELQAVIARVNQDNDRLWAERNELLAAFRRMADVIEQLRQSRGLGRDG